MYATQNHKTIFGIPQENLCFLSIQIRAEIHIKSAIVLHPVVAIPSAEFRKLMSVLGGDIQKGFD